MFEIAGVDALALEAGPVRCSVLAQAGLAALISHLFSYWQLQRATSSASA